jgi:hypothetical protein
LLVVGLAFTLVFVAAFRLAASVRARRPSL